MTETLSDPRAASPGPDPAIADARSDGSATGGAGPEEADRIHRPKAWKRRRRAVRWWSFLTFVALVALVALGFVGYDAATDLRGGAVSKVITDPGAAGFVASVEPTPVHLLALVDGDDELSAFVALVPPDGGADDATDAQVGEGAVLWSLGELVIERDGAETSLSKIYGESGATDARAAFEEVLGFGATDLTVVGPDQMAAIVEAMGSLEVRNPDPVSVDDDGRKVQRYASGALELEPDEVQDYLTVRGVGEAPENRSTRAEIVIDALVAGLADAPGADSGVLSDSGSDVGSLIASMGTRIDFVVLPMQRQEFSGSFLYRPDIEQIAAELADVVQFPVSAFPGQRPRVRVLNGTADVSLASAVAPRLARAGGEVLLIGNADRLDASATSVTYADPAFADVADRIAELMGITAERTEEQSDAADIDVLIGADYQP